MSFERGNKDGKHYWLTPPDLMKELQDEFALDFDACPHPWKAGGEFDGLRDPWGTSTYVNPPFGSISGPDGKKLGPTAWVRKAISENAQGKTVVLMLPTDKWIHYLLKAGAEFRSYGDVRWHSIEDNRPGKGIGRFTMAFILRGR
jgi:hypothetical protein